MEFALILIRGVDLILDPVGASHWPGNIASLAPAARWIFIGTMGGKEVTLDIGQLMRRRAKLIGSVLRGLPLADKRRVVERFREHFFG